MFFNLLINKINDTKLLLIIPLLIIGAGLGLLSSVVPVSITLGAIVALILLTIILRKPEIGVLLIVVLVSSIIFEEGLPLVPIGIGSFHVTDIILIALLLLILWKKLLGTADIIRTPLDTPLIIFYTTCVVSALISVKFYGTDYTPVIRTLRAVTYYLTFFVITNYITTFSQLKLLIKGLITIATIVSIAMILQAIIGDSVSLMPGRIEKSGTFEEYDTLRILPPGQTLLYIFFITGFCTTIIENRIIDNKYLNLLILCLLGSGIILTYNRTYWIAIIIVISILYYFLKRPEKKRFLSLMTTALILGFIGSTFVLSSKNKFGETLLSVSERFSSVFAGKKLTTSSSLDDRYTENKYALNKIKANFIIGNGLGNSYRPSIFGSKDELTSYIHNGYFWLLLNTGLLGFLAYFWFYLGFIRRGYKNFFKIDKKLKPFMAGFFLSGIGILPMALLNPIFMQWYSIVVLSIVIGMNEVIIKISNNYKLEESK